MKRHLALALLLSGSALVLIPYIVFLKASASGAKSRAVASAPARLGDRATVHAAGRGAPRINLADGREVLTAYAGDPALQQLLEQNLAQPLAMASGDFDEDGVPDLISAYAGPSSGVLSLHRGNVDAIFPNTTEANYRKAQGAFTDAPFLSPARLLGLPVSPDFIGAGDFDADGHSDLAAAARGGHSLYLLAGNGNGGFGSPESIALPGAVTALAIGEINRRDGLADVIVGIITPAGPQVLIFQNATGALRAAPESFALPDAAMDFALGQFDSDALPDLAIAAGHNLMVVYGRDREASPNAAQPQAPRAITSRQSFPFTLQSLASGDFTGKPQASLAALSGDGTVYLLNATFRKQGNAEKAKKNLRWKTQVLAQGTWSGSARLLKARVSSLPQDDLLVIDSSNRQLRIIETGNREPSEQQAISSSSGRGTLVDLDVEDEPVAALPMRLNADAINDLVILRKHNFAPSTVTTQSAMTFTVTDSTDNSAGSLRKAIIDANANSGADTIVFAVSIGPQTITLTSALPTITEAVTIDGTTQPGFVGSPLIQLNGNAVPAGGSGLTISSGNCVVRALVINRFTDNAGAGGAGIIIQTGGNSLLEGNFIGTDGAGGGGVLGNFIGVSISNSSGNTVGGVLPSSRNVISGNITAGVLLSGTSIGNQIQGNFIGTDVTGTAPLGNNLGVQFEGVANNTLGGTAAGARNIISSNGRGVLIRLGSSGNIVQGNFIGTDVSGNSALFNDGNGVTVQDGTTNTIGGTAAGAGNVISGNGGDGLGVIAGSGNTVQGNFIGTNASGNAALPNSGIGVVLTGGSNNNTVGGTLAGAGNRIAFNSLGVAIPGGSGNAVLSNSIFSNIALGINLSDDGGVTPNDLCDADPGANGLQNFPVLTSATSGGGNTVLQGTLDSTASTAFRVEFFSNTACDPSGNGEGQTFIGSTNVTTSGVCVANINVALPVAVPAGQVVTATATDPANNTSEFSQCVTVTAMGPVSDLQITKSDSPDPVVSGSNITYTMVVTNNGPDTDAGATFTDLVPAGTTFVSLTSPGTCSTPPVGGTGTVSCSLGALATSGSVAITLVVNVNAAPGATITNTATISGMSSDSNPGNNSATASTAVISGPCTITCPPTQIKSNDLNQCGAVVTYPPPTTAGACGTATCAPASGSFFPKGTTVVTCNTGDGPSCAFNVTVNDTQPPTITCPPNQTVAANVPSVVNYPPPTVSDNCPGVTAGCVPPSGSLFPVGTTTVTCTATDMSGNITGNTASCTFTVTVATCTITCPADVLRVTSPTDSSCGALVSYLSPTTSGACGTVNCAPPSGSFFNVGTATVTCTTSAGPSCSFGVTVVDAAPPTINCSTGVTAPLPAGQLSAVVNYPAATATDNCSIASVVCVPPSGSTFPAGSTLVTCTARDAFENSNRCFFFVTLLDGEVPVIVCPPNVNAALPAGQTSSVVNYPPPTVTDNFPGVNVVCLPASGASFPAGSTTVTCTATDATGNKSSCSFIVGVGGPQARVTIPGNKTSVEFAAAPTRKPPKPKNSPCSLFTIQNIGLSPLVLTFESLRRTGSDVTNGRISDPNDLIGVAEIASRRFFVLGVVNPDQSLTGLGPGSILTFQPGEAKTLCLRFAAFIPGLAGKTTGLAASDVLPNILTSTISFRQNAGANIEIPILARVGTGVVLIDPANPRRPPVVTFTRSGNDITVSYAVFDSNLDVSRAKYEFLDNGGQVVAGPFEIDLAASISSANLLRGQSFSVEQRFTGASSNPEVTGVRLTVFDGETSAGAPSTSSATSISAASVQLMNRARRVTLYPPDVKLR